MSKRQTQKTAGFGAIGVIVVLIAIALIGLVAWRFYDASKSKTASSSTSSTQANAKTPAKTDPYAGWKTYCSSETNACFKYDSSWTFAECAPARINVEEFQNCPSSESISLIAPGRTARISWDVDSYDVTKPGTCTKPSSEITQSDATKVPSVDNLYSVNVKYDGSSNYDYTGYLGLTAGENGLPPTVGQAGSLCPAYSGFISKDGKYKIDFSFNFNVNMSPNVPASQRVSPPSQAVLSGVKQILLSYYSE
jgi:hypothetical protein